MTILIITPLPKEHKALLAGFGDLHAQPMSLDKLATTHLPGLNLMLAIGGVSKAQFALQTMHLLHSMDHQPEVVICAGASGALHESLSIGDVVVGVQTVEHDYRNGFSQRRRPRFDGHPPTIDRLRAVEPLGFRVMFGAIASGDEDIIGQARRAEVRAETGAAAVAWEGAGGARACAFMDVPYVEIRGISDSASESAPTEFRANLSLAMGNLGKLIRAWLA
jgi:adenosylhomocysteine nucleosidase